MCVAGSLTGVLAGAVHGGHPGALLAGGRLPQGQVDDVDQSKLLVVSQHISIDVIIDAHRLCVLEECSVSVTGTHEVSESSQHNTSYLS